MDCEGGRAGRGAPSLVAISLDWLATNINLVSGLDFVPEDLVVSLFQVELFGGYHWEEGNVALGLEVHLLSRDIRVRFARHTAARRECRLPDRAQTGSATLPISMQRVLQQGRLTPRVLDKFLASGHPAIAELVDKLRIRNWTPPLIVNDGRGFLGDKSHLW